MRAGDVFYPVVRVTSAGAAVLSLVAADFTLSSYVNATTPTCAFTVTELGSGYYRFAITSSGTAGWHQYRIVSVAAYTVSPKQAAGWLGLQDYDTIFAAVVRPVATLGSTAVIASALGLDVIANRYTPITVAVTDQTGAAVDLSGYNNWRFSVWDKTHAATIYTLSSGITGSALGIVSWAIPETAAFYTQMAAAITAGNDSLTLYYDMVADQAATPAQSRTVFRGALTLYRYESPA